MSGGDGGAAGGPDRRDDEVAGATDVPACSGDGSSDEVDAGLGPIDGEIEAAGAEGLAGPDDLGADDPVGQLRVERDEYLDALRRLQADFENYRKRVQRQQEEVVARAGERLVAALLPALDAFDLAAEHLVGDEQVSPGGLLQAAALLRDTLAKEGLERVGEPGDPFDPNAHEAVEHTADESGQGPVVDAVLRSGYRYNGRTVRPAMVRVRG